MVVTFCGHSSFIKTPRLEEELLRLLEERVGEAPADFLLGGYGGFDAFAYQCCNSIKKSIPKPN